MSQSMEKSLVLLELVASGCSTLSDLAAASRLPKSTTHRLVSVLLNKGFLRMQANRYFLGYKLLELGELTRQQIHLPAVAKRHMESTSRRTSETIHLGKLVDKDIIYLEKVEGNRGLQMASRVGVKTPAQTTAMGKALIAQLIREEWKEFFLPIPAKTVNTITELEAYFEELEAVREQGYAVDWEENEIGIRCVAAPVWDATGTAIAAVSLSGAAVYITRERLSELVPEVIECAQAISQELGGQSFSKPSG